MQAWDWLSKSPLRFLLLVLLLALLPTALLAYLATRTLHTQVHDRILRSGAQLSELAGTLVNKHFEETTIFLRSYAGRYNFRKAWQDGNYADLQRHLDQARQLNPDLEFVNVFDPRGILKVTAPSGSAFVGQSFAHLEWYHGVSREWKPYVSDVFKTQREPQILAIVVAVPVHGEDGKLLGILTAAHSVETISTWLQHAGSDGRWALTIFDRQTQRAAYPGMTRQQTPEKWPGYEPAARGALGEAGRGLYEFDGQVYASAFTPIKAYGWTAVADQPAALVDREIGAVTRQIWLLALLVVLLAAGLGGLLAVLVRRMAQAERFFNLSQELLCITGSDGRIKRMNPAMARTLGYEPGELLGRINAEYMHPDDKETTRKAMQRIGQDDRVISFEARTRNKDGRYLWLLWHVTPLPETGEILGVGRDITGRKQAEEELLRLNAALSRRSAELDGANRELEAFSYSVSHDLRAPLRSIDGFGQALLEDCGPQLDAEGTRYIGRIRAATKRMGDLIDGLLRLSRVTRVELEHVEVDLSALGHQVVEELRGAQPGRSVTVEIEPGMKTIGDPQLLRTVLENLLGNAWKFTSKKPDAKVEFSSRKGENNRITYVIRDNGAGFDMEYAGKLFGAFQRLHGDAEFPGSGIGLATVQRIIARHGGTIRAESAVNQGASFCFELGQAGNT